ncbi:unnamed protein product [Miscanthus lutarioriparius]|uniref:Uncharacterized protein n=1 Tax=Miscanthus lutarioriparius TaxID=422564 RepID=A0A811S5D6_9POAL|nr:unnamed protein product [Miscanthus lutarioriparius]
MAAPSQRRRNHRHLAGRPCRGLALQPVSQGGAHAAGVGDGRAAARWGGVLAAEPALPASRTARCSASARPRSRSGCWTTSSAWFADHATTEFGVLALSGGTILGLVYKSRNTVALDVATQPSSPGPQLRDAKLRPAMLAVGDDTVVVMDSILRGGDCCCFEALRRVPGAG